MGRGRAALARLLLLGVACCSLWPVALHAATPAQAAPAPITFAAQASRVQAVRQLNAGDDAIYAGDVSVPDHTVFSPGQPFVKTWRIRNSGTTTWSQAYHWHFEAGAQLSTLTAVAVPVTRPGVTVEISVPMTAPLAPGSYASFWQMADASGKIFGHQAWV